MALKQAIGAGWESSGLLMENGQGPTVRIADSHYVERGQWSATVVVPVDGVAAVGDILINRDILGSDPNLIAHALVHEIGHWAYWNSKTGQRMDGLWEKHLNASQERNICTSKEDPTRVTAGWKLPHEGYSAERSVFGELRLSR